MCCKREKAAGTGVLKKRGQGRGDSEWSLLHGQEGETSPIHGKGKILKAYLGDCMGKKPKSYWVVFWEHCSIFISFSLALFCALSLASRHVWSLSAAPLGPATTSNWEYFDLRILQASFLIFPRSHYLFFKLLYQKTPVTLFASLVLLAFPTGRRDLCIGLVRVIQEIHTYMPGICHKPLSLKTNLFY